METNQPLDLPESFDPELNMPATETDQGRFHVTRAAAGLARRLVENGTDIDLQRAEAILRAVLDCQETRESDPHRGNFTWMAEDDFVADLNAVEFVLAQLIPMLADHRDRIERSAPSLLPDLLSAIRAGLDEVARMDVHIGYTNIAIFDIHNTILGGELLDEPRYTERGKAKLGAWAEFTAGRGHPLEYNSPTYTPLALRTLESLAQRVADPAAKTLATTMAARLALSVALRLHGPTRRMAGPHGRGYNDAVRRGSSPRELRLFDDLAAGSYPWLESLAGDGRLPRVVEETASPEQGYTMTTLLAPTYTLGTASAPFMGQSNALIAYVGSSAEGGDGTGDASVFYTRYLTDEKWYGDFYHATDRSTSRNLLDEGMFHGVQSDQSVIAAYAPRSLEGASGAKAVLVWSDVDQASEILVGGRPVGELPARVAPGESVAVAVGTAFFLVRPLTRIGLGSGDGVTLTERDGSLVLELVQYRGPRKDFWELRWPGGFYQGKPLNAFYLETAEASDHESLAAFAQTVADGELSERLDPPRTYDGMSTRMWEAEYRRGGRVVGMRIELYTWSLVTRWDARGEKGWPPLDAREGAEASAIASQSSSGSVEAGGARLTCAHGPAWLCADPSRRLWYAGFVGAGGGEGPVELATPEGTVRLEAAVAGWVSWKEGKVTSDAIGSDVRPQVTTSAS